MSKRLSQCYNTRNINDGIIEWTNMTVYRDHEKTEEEQEVLLVNTTVEEVLKAIMEELQIWKNNDVMVEIETK